MQQATRPLCTVGSRSPGYVCYRVRDAAFVPRACSLTPYKTHATTYTRHTKERNWNTGRKPYMQISCRAGAQNIKQQQDPAELLKGAKTVLSELTGLDFPRSEVKAYFQLVVKVPMGMDKDFDLNRARTALAKVTENKGVEEFTDVEGLQATVLMLYELWRWRRRGGGMDDETDMRPHAVALVELQNMEPEQIDRITSSLLDNLPMTDQQKRDLGGGVQRAAVASIGGAVWGSLAASLLFVAWFAFNRGG